MILGDFFGEVFMEFDFFTFGGAVFWEDVFFYQRWRIQRNCFTKKYRLLDSWDIRRASGSFETCQRAFVKYIKSYEIPPQRGKMVILLHGYGDSKNIFKPLWRNLVLTNATVAALNFPSLFRSSLASAYQLLFFLNHVDDINEVSFVTKGAGNLILQRALNLPMEQQTFRTKMRVGNVVEINPTIKENLLCEILSKFRIFRFLLGPMISEFKEENIKRMVSLPADIKTLKIFSDSKLTRLYLRMLKLCRIPVDAPKYPKKGTLYIRGTTFYTLQNQEILNYTVKFINNGKI